MCHQEVHDLVLVEDELRETLDEAEHLRRELHKGWRQIQLTKGR